LKAGPVKPFSKRRVTLGAIALAIGGLAVPPAYPAMGWALTWIMALTARL